MWSYLDKEQWASSKAQHRPILISQFRDRLKALPTTRGEGGGGGEEEEILKDDNNNEKKD